MEIRCIVFVMSLLLFSGCIGLSTDSKDAEGDYFREIDVDCVGCDFNFHSIGHKQCMGPCRAGCLGIGYGMEGYYKVTVGGRLICQCKCSLDADLLNLDRAVFSGNGSLCDRILDNKLMHTCYGRVAGETGDEVLCEKIGSDDEVGRNICYIYLAVAKKQGGLCDKITVQGGMNSRDTCFALVGGETGNVSLCEKISVDEGNNSRDVCIAAVAVKNRNPLLCEEMKRLSGENSRDTCYVLLAVELENASLCEKVRLQTGRNSKDCCYMDLAFRTKNTSLCSKVSLGEGRYSQKACMQELR